MRNLEGYPSKTCSQPIPVGGERSPVAALRVASPPRCTLSLCKRVLCAGQSRAVWVLVLPPFNSMTFVLTLRTIPCNFTSNVLDILC